jgi:type II secretory pathway pseudopilin PulG
MNSRRPAFSLVEVVLAIAVGLVLMSGTIAAYNAVRQGSQISQARTMVGTIQTNIGMDKFRNGSPPPMTPSASPSGVSVWTNLDSAGKAYWPNAPVNGQLPPDPVLGKATLMPYSSTAAPTALAAGAPTEQWDNPCFYGSAAATAGYGKGGWLYDASTGAFRINLSNKDYPGDKPSGW